jgi:hypothetical protein
MTDRRAWSGVLFAAFLGVAACNNGDPVGDTISPASFYGTYSDQSGAEGRITLVPGQRSDAGVYVQGSLDIAGQSLRMLGGTYDSSGLHFEDIYEGDTFYAPVSGGVAMGTGSGPAGSAVFVLFRDGNPRNVAASCGTAVCTAPAGCDVLVDITLSVEGKTALLTASVSGTVFVGSGTATASVVDFHIVQGGIDVTIHGTLDGGAASGTWSDAINGTSGTWSTGACS